MAKRKTADRGAIFDGWPATRKFAKEEAMVEYLIAQPKGRVGIVSLRREESHRGLKVVARRFG